MSNVILGAKQRAQGGVGVGTGPGIPAGAVPNNPQQQGMIPNPQSPTDFIMYSRNMQETFLRVR